MQTPEEGEDIKRNEAALRYAEAGRYARGIQTDTTADIQRAAETQIQGDMEALAIDAAAKKRQ
jgi:hypothetical protein